MILGVLIVDDSRLLPGWCSWRRLISIPSELLGVVVVLVEHLLLPRFARSADLLPPLWNDAGSLFSLGGGCDFQTYVLVIRQLVSHGHLVTASLP